MSLMPRIRRDRRVPVTLKLAALLLAVVLVPAAWAQDASMTLYVFKKGLPQQDIEILLDEQLVGVTGEAGVIRFDIPAGIRFLEIRDQDLVVLSQQLLVNQGLRVASRKRVGKRELRRSVDTAMALLAVSP